MDEDEQVLVPQPPLLPYGLPAVKELLTFLISLLNPYDRHNTDTMRAMGLSILTIAFEVGGVSITRFPSLISLVRDDMAKQLFGLVASKDVKNPMVCGSFESFPMKQIKNKINQQSDGIALITNSAGDHLSVPPDAGSLEGAPGILLDHCFEETSGRL